MFFQSIKLILFFICITGLGQTQLIRVDGIKDKFYNRLTGPDDGFIQMRYFTNSDNGRAMGDGAANGDRDADLSAKLWTAWDTTYWYIYEEVRDDTLCANSNYAWDIDCMKIKVDPQIDDTTEGYDQVWDCRLTALGINQVLPGQPVDDLETVTGEKCFFRCKTDSGYILEMAIPWSSISKAGETITPAIGSKFGAALQNHDNDGEGRDATVSWAAVLLDKVWSNVKYHGTIEFLADNKLKLTAKNVLTGRGHDQPYDGSDFIINDEWPDDPIDLIESPIVSPTKFMLYQNYPNPFNPSTTIGFLILKSGEINLTVYDSMGKKVLILIENKFYQAGYHIVTFNSWNLASGIYFYRLQFGNRMLVKKMLLIR
jgi:hypothetical protein